MQSENWTKGPIPMSSGVVNEDRLAAWEFSERKSHPQIRENGTAPLFDGVVILLGLHPAPGDHHQRYKVRKLSNLTLNHSALQKFNEHNYMRNRTFQSCFASYIMLYSYQAFTSSLNQGHKDKYLLCQQVTNRANVPNRAYDLAHRRADCWAWEICARSCSPHFPLRIRSYSATYTVAGGLCLVSLVAAYKPRPLLLPSYALIDWPMCLSQNALLSQISSSVPNTVLNLSWMARARKNYCWFPIALLYRVYWSFI